MMLDLILFLLTENIVHQNTKLKSICRNANLTISDFFSKESRKILQNMLISVGLSAFCYCRTYNLLMDVGKREKQHVYFLD